MKVKSRKMNNFPTNCLKNIYTKTKLNNSVTIQIIDIKEVLVDGETTYQLIISDGNSWSSNAILIRTYNEMVELKNIRKFAIIEIQDFDLFIIKSNKSEELVIIQIKQLTIIENQSSKDEILCDPKELIITKINLFENESSNKKKSSNSNDNTKNNSKNDFKTIKDLNSDLKDWSIKARVSEKYPLRKWENKNGSGNILNFELIDYTGMIRAVAFRDLANQYETLIHENEIYKISNGIIRKIKDEYKISKINMEILITNETIIEIIKDENEKMPMKTYDFCSLKEVKNKKNNELVDIIGICWQIGELETVSLTSSNKTFIKKDIILVDNTDTLKLTIWNETAEKFNHEIQTIIMVHNARINEFNDVKYITTTNNTIIRINPVMENNDFLTL